MGDEKSLNPPGNLKPYGWLKHDHALMFADFLKLKKVDPTVKQIIILGDLFDEWVCPAEISPIIDSSKRQYIKIATAPQNREIIETLKEIAKMDEIELLYVPGNHDMLMTKDIVTAIIPGIKYISDKGIFLEDGIVAEHGSNYCLFNAPDPCNNPGHILPLGYFITRAVAENSARTGNLIDTIEAIAESVEGILNKEKIGDIVLNTVVTKSGMDINTPIKMNGINNYNENIKIQEIEKKFGDIYQLWNIQKPGNVPNEEALINDLGYLYPAAISQYFTKKDLPDIVIFGHTHKCDIHSIPLEDSTEEKNHHLCLSKHIYANCGTWINGKECTFVETEIKDNKHHVRLMKYESLNSKPIIKVISERHKHI